MGEFRILNSNNEDITANFGGSINNDIGEIVFPSNNGNDDNVDVVYNVIWKSNNISSNQSSVTVKECVNRSILEFSGLLGQPSVCLKKDDSFPLLINSRDRAGNLIGPPNLKISVSSDTDRVLRDFIIGTGSTGEFIIEDGGELSDYKCVIKSVKKYDGFIPEGDDDIGEVPIVILNISNGVADDITCDVPICIEVSDPGGEVPDVSIIYVVGQVEKIEEYGVQVGYRARVICSHVLPDNIRLMATVAYHVMGNSDINYDTDEILDNCHSRYANTDVFVVEGGKNCSDWKQFYFGKCECELDIIRYCGGLGSLSIIKTGSNGASVNVLKCRNCDCNVTASAIVDGVKYICRGNGSIIHWDSDNMLTN